jgi:Mg2+/Co2+ transporter CorB
MNQNEDNGMAVVFYIVVIFIFLSGFFAGRGVTVLMQEERCELMQLENKK